MELKSLYTLKKILETGSFQEAALALNYAQSTITFQIRRLESELGIRLFEKKGGRMCLTKEGEAALPRIERVIAAAEDLRLHSGAPDGGTLNIVAAETIATYKLPPVLEAFHRQAPHVCLTLRVMNCFDIVERMKSGEAELAIHYDVGRYPRNFLVEKLERCPVALVASPSLSVEQCDFITPHRRKELRHIQDDPNALSLKLFQRYLSKKDITLGTPLELWSVELVKRTAAAGLGVAALARFAVAAELERGELQELKTGINTAMTAVCAYRRDAPNFARDTFMRCLRECYPRE